MTSKPFRLTPLLKISAAIFLLLTAGHAETPQAQDPVIGKWRWTDKQIVECHADGSFNASPTNRKGKWHAVDSKSATLKYEFTWDDGLYVDTLLMSNDHKELNGKNKDKKKISGTKIDPTTEEGK